MERIEREKNDFCFWFHKIWYYFQAVKMYGGKELFNRFRLMASHIVESTLLDLTARNGKTALEGWYLGLDPVG